MERTILTVKLGEKGQPLDLEVPAELELELLVPMIAEALQWKGDSSDCPSEYEVWARPPGRVLTPGESLADAGAWDGAQLIFREAGDPSAKSYDPPDKDDGPGDQGPVKGWVGLGLDLPAEPESTFEEDPLEELQYVWKQLD